MSGRTAIAGIIALVLFQLGTVSVSAAFEDDHGGSQRGGACGLANGIKHVVNVTFDNTHLSRDRQNVPSDLEQMPNLLNFLRGNGTLDDNEHTILISHTAGGILSGLTGLYPDRNGITVSNSYGYFDPDKNVKFSGAFKYWTDPVDDLFGTADKLPNMVTTGQKTTPAPWVPYTRAGCDFGAVATANVVLENTGTGAFGDMTTVFGVGSPEWNEAKATPRTAQTDFVGLAVHCGQPGGLCKSNSSAKPDRLPDEPGGYNGFNALFGAKYVNPAITTHPSATVNDLNGNPIADASGHPGFPGFEGMSAAVSLGYVAQMQEAGVPVTFAYISDAHDNHTLSRASGPGEADYVAQLKDYDKAFGDFFKRLAADGIDKSNTLFVFTSDENDHFAGGNSTDGTWSHLFCNVSGGQTCPANQIGEVNQNINALLGDFKAPTYAAHFDSAPTIYVAGNPATGSPELRQFQRTLAASQAVDPYLSPSPGPVMLYLADTVGEQALHMVNADPQRTPNFTFFAKPDYFLKTSNTNCPDAAHAVATCIDYHFAWSHGDATVDIGRTWLGLVGPGVRKLGQTSKTWTDHTDIRPTMLSLLGLQDRYEQDGRVLEPFLTEHASPEALREDSLRRLGTVYKQIDAPFAEFATNTLRSSTRALASGSSSDDSTYASIESQIRSQTERRDALAAEMRTILNRAARRGEFEVEGDHVEGLVRLGEALLRESAQLAGGI